MKKKKEKVEEKKGCGKRFEMKYKGLHINVACGDSNFEKILPLCPDCKKPKNHRERKNGI